MQNSSAMDSLPESGTVAVDTSDREQAREQPQEDQQPQPQQGIDIHQALSILSERSGPSAIRQEGCDCCHGSHVPEDAKFMGQTIDMFAPTQPSAEVEESKEETMLHKERTERLEKIRQQLHTMTDRELLQAVMKAQEDRVTTYREYERGLKVVLQTGNLTSYPDTCSKATAAFSVLSETITAIQGILGSSQPRQTNNTSKNRRAKLIQQLQQQEKEKLHLTAAHHLERIRQRNQQLQSHADPRIDKLLQEGVTTLQTKIHHCVQQINETMEEIRCEILEGDDDE